MADREVPVLWIRYFHISHTAPYLPLAPQILHNPCFSFRVHITAVPREIVNNPYAQLWEG